MKCPELINPIHGKVKVQAQTVGSTAEYRCDETYVLTGGDRVRKCLAGGRWSGKAPFCQCKVISRLHQVQEKRACNSVNSKIKITFIYIVTWDFKLCLTCNYSVVISMLAISYNAILLPTLG